MRLDQLQGSPDSRVAWSSDVATKMLRRFGIRSISLDSGAQSTIGPWQHQPDK